MNSPRMMEAGRADLIEQLRHKHAHGEPMTARGVGHSLYNKCRRAFPSWAAALEAAGLEVGGREDGHGYGPTELLKTMDAISPHPLPGLPKMMRERQILGGLILERFAEKTDATFGPLWHIVEPRLIADTLADAFVFALHRWNQEHVEPRFQITQRLSAEPPGTHAVVERFDIGTTTGIIDLPNETPVEHG